MHIAINDLHSVSSSSGWTFVDMSNG